MINSFFTYNVWLSCFLTNPYQMLGPNLPFTIQAKKLHSILQKLLTQHLIYFYPKPPRKQLPDFPSPAVPPPHVFCPSVPGWSAQSVPNSPHQPCVVCSLWAPWRSNISTLRIMGSQNWWFGDPCYRESNPSFFGGSNRWFLGNIKSLEFTPLTPQLANPSWMSRWKFGSKVTISGL